SGARPRRGHGGGQRLGRDPPAGQGPGGRPGPGTGGPLGGDDRDRGGGGGVGRRHPGYVAGLSDKNSNTAFTRRWTSVSSDRFSFEKIELMCFSTARSLRIRVDAMAALFFPWAISPRISRSRGVSR